MSQIPNTPKCEKKVETPISEIIKTSLENVKNTIDSNTVIGEPMQVLDGTVIVPVSKVSCGIATGGSDFGGKNSPKNFGGGGGTGITVTPIAFLVINSSGDVKMLNVGENSGYASAKVADALAAVDGIIDKAPGMAEKIVNIFKKEKSGAESTENTENTESSQSIKQ